MKRLAVVFAFAACHAGAPPSTGHSVPSALTAVLTLARHDYAKDSDVEVTVDLRNDTASPIEENAAALESATVLLEVRDSSGHRVAPESPPVPSTETKRFAPGEHATVKVRLGIFSPPLARGAYEVAPARSIAHGAAVSFAIVP